MRRLLAAALLCFAAPVLAQAGEKIDRFSVDASKSFDLEKLEWFDDPTLPKGAKVSLIAGNPGAPGVFMVYIKLPANYSIPPHTHPFAEAITILKGRIGNGHGDNFERGKGEVLEAGATFVLPAGHSHYLWNDEEVVGLLVATGPWDIKYVDPKDDPRSK